MKTQSVPSTVTSDASSLSLRQKVDKRYAQRLDRVEFIRVNGKDVPVDDSIEGLGPDDDDEYTRAMNCDNAHLFPFNHVREDADRFVFRYYETPVSVNEHRLFGKVYFGSHVEGPPFHVHGGALCSVMDHILGRTPWHFAFERDGNEFKPFLVVAIKVNMKQSVPTQSVQSFETHIAIHTGRKQIVKGRIFNKKTNTTFCEGEAILIQVPVEHYKKMIQTKL